jgi:CHRD domain
MLGWSAAPQGAVFRARLSPVPVDSANSAVITGSGSVTATLSGCSLSVQGTYEGMRSAATMARIHLGPRGVRGPAVFDLTVTKATSGSLGGTFMLTPEQVEDVRRGRFYVQVHSEKATEGNLWGWLLP